MLMRIIDKLYMKRPFYGAPRITDWLNAQGYMINHKRVERLMGVMGVQAIMPGPHTSRPHPDHKKYPYLLRDVDVTRPDQAWCTDITYIPMYKGFMYLVAVMDWYSRYVLSWEISNTLESDFCIEALTRALDNGCPEIFNTDQGSQFTSAAWISVLDNAGVRISMDGRGRALDNVFIERLWRTVKYEDIYLREYCDGHDLFHGLTEYFKFYNSERPHSSLGKRTPEVCYHDT